MSNKTRIKWQAFESIAVYPPPFLEHEITTYTPEGVITVESEMTMEKRAVVTTEKEKTAHKKAAAAPKKAPPKEKK